MTTLHVSLGHNSSAVLTQGDRVVRGYEQERIDRKKSSSAYPREAIELAVRNEFVDDVCVGHWFDRFSLETNKYLDLDHLSRFGKVRTLSPEFTHHDSHMQSAMSFLRGRDTSGSPTMAIVLDGFGNLQECLSVYRSSKGGDPVLSHRSYGYRLSLGLMYQYTTEYLGMKPHRDEYKLLGYEAKIMSFATKGEIGFALEKIMRQAERHVEEMLEAHRRPEATDELIAYDQLNAARSMWWENAHTWRKLWPAVVDDVGIRACVAFCAQTFLEECVRVLLDRILSGERRLVLVGGCFLNVKLNRSIALRHDVSQVAVNPLAGDQGAALGHTAGVVWDRLSWGERPIGGVQGLPPGVFYCHPGEWSKVAADHLQRNRIVNVVRGGMEFGPRALCNTTTFALPNSRNVSRINALNERDEAMPMAPIMTRLAAAKFLDIEEISKQFPCMPYMITTCRFSEMPPEALMGVAHRDPLLPIWTARPQIADESDAELHNLLSWTPNEVLINTSFNYHGEPIVFTEDDAVRTHSMQAMRAALLGIEGPVTLLVRS